MLSQRTIESFVGLFLVGAMLALLVLAFKVSGLTSIFKSDGYVVMADFDDIGGLKVRAAVKIGGVKVGEVSHIKLNPQTFKASVSMNIQSKFNDIPNDSSASILTAGLLGDNYIELSPMYSETFLKNGSLIEDTHSAMILERMIGQFMYKIGHSDSDESSTAANDTKNTSADTLPSQANKASTKPLPSQDKTSTQHLSSQSDKASTQSSDAEIDPSDAGLSRTPNNATKGAQ